MECALLELLYNKELNVILIALPWKSSIDALLPGVTLITSVCVFKNVRK